MPADQGRYNQNKIYGQRTRKINDCNLVAHIPLNGNLDDIKGSNCGTVTGCISVFNSAPLLNGARFDGSNDYVSLANECNFDFDRCCAFSVSVWMKPDTTAVDCFPMMIGNRVNINCTNTGWGLSWQSVVDRITFQVSNGVTRFTSASACCSIIDCEWQHVTTTYDGSSNISGMKVYINGVISSGAGCEAITGSLLNCNPVVIGAGTTGNRDYEGCLADVRIFSSELTSTQANLIYQQGRPRANRLNHIADCSILLWTEFNMCVVCQAGNCNNGTWERSGCPEPCPNYTRGIFNRAGNFPGCNGVGCIVSVQIANECQFDFTNATAFSISLWVQTCDSTQTAGYVSKGCLSGGSAGWSLSQCFTAERLKFNFANNCFSQASLFVDCTGIGDGGWHHVVYTKAASSAIACSHFYIDNCKTSGVSGTYPGGNLNCSPVTLGAGSGAKFAWTGRMTCVMVWNRQITDAEVARLYNER